MRKVVDSNYLQSEQLRRFLVRSKENSALLTDYAAMEAYKGDTLVSIYKSMSVLSEFPDQVVILKNTIAVCGLSGQRSGLQRRLIDVPQTRDFTQYCDMLAEARAGNLRLQTQLLALGRDATEHLERMLSDASGLGDVISELAEDFTRDELSCLRSKARPSQEMLKKIIGNVLQISRTAFGGHPSVRKRVYLSDLPNTYIFRASLCAYLLALDWIAAGGSQGAKASTFRNDMVDMTFAAYATYFDGLLSNDAKTQRIYCQACLLLRFIFGSEINVK